jgi:carboxymethylenebutenolidase
MQPSEIQIQTSDGAFSAYLAYPEGEGISPGIVVIQEIFGVNAVMREIADAYAQKGYLAIVPDLFWRQEPNVQLSDASQDDWNRAFELYRGFDENLGTQDLIATAEILRQLPECSGNVGSVGFCLGGKLAYLMATRSDTQCNVGYYGVNIQDNLDEAPNIENPLLLHIAEDDEYVPTEAQQQVKSALSGNSCVTLHSYPNVQHGFARAGGNHYDEAAANLANQRTLEFFEEYLSVTP